MITQDETIFRRSWFGVQWQPYLFYLLYQYSEAEAQADWFCKNTAEGLAQAGLSRINQSIGPFVYCVLGAQVNVRKSILGSEGRAKEAQSEFLVLVEDAITQPDLQSGFKDTSLPLTKQR